jgi:glycogen synthase
VKILHVPPAYSPVVGGTERNCQRFSEVLASQGHDVRVLTANVGGVEGYYRFGIPPVTCANEMISGVNVTRLPFSNGFYQLGGWAEANLLPPWLGKRLEARTMELLRGRFADMITDQIIQIRPDVVMTMPHLVTNVGAVLVARQRVRFPLVMVPMLHEHDPNWNRDQMIEALRHADAVVALTAHEVERLATAYGVPREKIFLASVGMDLDAPCLSEQASNRRVVFIGRKSRSKGIGILIEAMDVVWSKYPDAELLMVGGRTSETVEIDRQVAKLPAPLRKQVRDVGVVSDREKAELLRSACCLALPSKIESFGMVILDAWAQARPVVTWDLPVFRSTIEDQLTGLLVDVAGGSRAMGEAILQIMQDTKAAARMGLAGRQRVETIYSWQTVAQVYLRAYEYAIGHAGAKRQ